MTTTRAARHLQSRDGTRIAYNRTGDGPPVILVEAAGHYRDLSSFDGLVPILAREFAVYTYDRRGRGESTDTPPYAPDREVEDLEAVIAACGGSACAYAFSSGGLLAMRAVAHGAGISRLAMLEPPLQEEDAEPVESGFTRDVAELVRLGRNGDAVEYFLVNTGVPADLIAQMRGTPEWDSMVSVAPTLVYDSMISDATTSSLLRSVAVPTLVLDSGGSTDNLTGWAADVARQLQQASHRSLAGAWHGVPDEILAPVLVEFFRG
jgi:pimeloyl-ACP methyl ester carboxylesterase